jgi:Ca-activated chloride channel homolog
VTLEAPARLALVIAPIALLVAYLIVQHGRRKYAVRFTSVDLLASVAPRRPGWQRHVSAGVLLLALLAMVVGLARPARVSKTPKKNGTILLTVDTSGSMAATDVQPSRLAAAEAAARSFVERLPSGLKVGLVSFNSNTDVLVAPTSDKGAVVNAINNLTVNGGTATGDAIKQSLAAALAQPDDGSGSKSAAAIVLMSDGSPTLPQNGPQAAVDAATTAAKKAKVPVDTIAFGTKDGTLVRNGETIPVPADPEAMAKIASATGGKSFTATSSEQLNSVYDQIRKSVGYDTVKHDLTVWWLGLGFVLALLCACAGLFWMQRIP